LSADLARSLPPNIDGKPLTEFVDDRDKLRNALAAYNGSGKGDPFALDLDPRHVRMRSSVDTALSLLNGVSARLTNAGQVLIPGTSAALELEITNNGKEAVQIDWLETKLGSTVLKQTKNAILKPESSTKVPIVLQVPADLGVTVPHAKHLYEDNFAGVPVSTAALITVKQTKFPLIVTKSFDSTPKVDIGDFGPSPIVVRPDEVGVSNAGADVFPAKLPDLKIQLINYLDERSSVEVLVGQKGQRDQTIRKVELLPHQLATLALPMPSPEKTSAAHIRASGSAEVLSVTVRAAGSKENLTTREVPIVRANARVARNLKVGYVRGFDFSLPNALNALGVQSEELSVDEVRTADLSKFTSFIVDNRVYESQPELIALNQKLLDYANAGGNLIVFYHKSDEWNPSEQRKRPQLAPYKLILGNERVTDENAPITFLEPDHPLLNTPNKIGPEDFVNWIQERGLYYPRDWDPQFRALLQSNDPGEAPLKGGLLVADYGRGHYIYTSMVWYRELRAGVPGAYRMLANMISYGK
jgi:hypothetical protein